MGVQVSLLNTDFNSFGYVFLWMGLLGHISVQKHKVFLQRWIVSKYKVVRHTVWVYTLLLWIILYGDGRGQTSDNPAATRNLRPKDCA